MSAQKNLQDQAANLVVPNEYGSIIVREGGVGLNAQTSQDNTGKEVEMKSVIYCEDTNITVCYYYLYLYSLNSFLAFSLEYFVSLPSNKLELWMALESGRFIAPVFRELYSEKEVSCSGKSSYGHSLLMFSLYLQYSNHFIVCTD
mgnify:CR=1 FL=1